MKEGSALSGLLLCQKDLLGLFASVSPGEAERKPCSRRPQEESYVLTYNDFGEAEGSARSQAEEEEEEVVAVQREGCLWR